jgi:hypothetical protein
MGGIKPRGRQEKAMNTIQVLYQRKGMKLIHAIFGMIFRDFREITNKALGLYIGDNSLSLKPLLCY